MGVGYSLDIKLSERLVVPILYEGSLCMYIARALGQEKPKEMGPSASSWPIRRSEVLYGYDELVRDVPVIVVEGMFDCEHLKKHGYNACAILGSNMSQVQMGQILSKNPPEIILMLDGDMAGQLAAKKLLWTSGSGIEVKLAYSISTVTRTNNLSGS